MCVQFCSHVVEHRALEEAKDNALTYADLYLDSSFLLFIAKMLIYYFPFRKASKKCDFFVNIRFLDITVSV